MGEDVIRKLQRHKLIQNMFKKFTGMGTWLAVFDNDGDLAGSISQHPNLMPILDCNPLEKELMKPSKDCTIQLF